MNFELSKPSPEDGPAIHNLISQCPPLDENSRYCNLLQASHFQDTAIVARHEGELVGLVTGYRLPAETETLFVWQVAVSPAARGERLGVQMLEALLERNDDVAHVETTVTPGNDASAAMFRRFASKANAEISQCVLFERDAHFESQHEDEVLLRIGPITGSGQPEPH